MHLQPSRRHRNSRKSGMTLVEVAVSFSIFAVAATGVVASLIQARRLSESNLAQGYAYSTAQAVIEEVIRVPPSMLAEVEPGVTTLKIKQAKLTALNYTALEDVDLLCAADDSTFQELGTTDAGILTDAAYIADSNEIRPERFMRMRFNLQCITDGAEDDHRVLIILRYQWEVPDRKGANGDPIFLNGEIRTIRSTALRF